MFVILCPLGLHVSNTCNVRSVSGNPPPVDQTMLIVFIIAACAKNCPVGNPCCSWRFSKLIGPSESKRQPMVSTDASVHWRLFAILQALTSWGNAHKGSSGENAALPLTLRKYRCQQSHRTRRSNGAVLEQSEGASTERMISFLQKLGHRYRTSADGTPDSHGINHCNCPAK